MDGFIACFEGLDDPRTGNAGRHDLLEILMIALCTVLCGGQSAVDMAEFAEDKEEFLRGFLTLKHGLPSHDTFSRIWPIHARTRSLLFRLLDLMDIRSATQDRSLLDALAIVVEHRQSRRDDLPNDLDLGFAAQRWRSFVTKRGSGGPTIDRRALEVCVFLHLTDALQAGDVYVIGAEAFADYRDQLLPWPECAPWLAAYCRLLDMPESAEAFVARLKDELTRTAAAVDAGFPDNTELSLDADGTRHLKKPRAVREPDGLADFEREIRTRMPERHLLDILKHTEHGSAYPRHFGPPSGSDPKLTNAVPR